MKIHFRFLLVVVVCLHCTSGHCQRNTYNLGDGLVLFQKEQVLFLKNDSVKIYADSNCTRLLLPLVPENTSCPECFQCAEPTSYHAGPLQPFLCHWPIGLAFVCVAETQISYAIYVTDAGAIGYIPKLKSQYFSWDTYMKLQAKNGEYMRFCRPDDTTVLYNRQYSGAELPRHNSNYTVGIKFVDLPALRFYPVQVSGYWMKLKAMLGKKSAGYCWIIWRNDKEWLKGFEWRE